MNVEQIRKLLWPTGEAGKVVLVKRDDADEFADPQNPKPGRRKPKLRFAKPKKPKVVKIAKAAIESGIDRRRKACLLRRYRETREQDQARWREPRAGVCAGYRRGRKSQDPFQSYAFGAGPRGERGTRAVSKRLAPADLGPAHRQVEALAKLYREEQITIGKRCTPEKAFTAVYTAPENVALRDMAKREERIAALRRADHVA